MRILVGYDGSNAAKDALKLAQKHAKAFDAKIDVVKIGEIIIGVRKRSKVGKLLLGSTAQYVVLHAPCPVITIK